MIILLHTTYKVHTTNCRHTHISPWAESNSLPIVARWLTRHPQQTCKVLIN